jgi:hypothetical protein
MGFWSSVGDAWDATVDYATDWGEDVANTVTLGGYDYVKEGLQGGGWSMFDEGWGSVGDYFGHLADARTGNVFGLSTSGEGSALTGQGLGETGLWGTLGLPTGGGGGGGGGTLSSALSAEELASGGGSGSGWENPFIMRQLAELASGSAGADITEQVQMDVLGPGYQQAEYGAAAAGVPGAGRVMRARGAVERKASIMDAQMRRQNMQVQHQLINAYLEQAYKQRKLDSDEAIALSELFNQTMAWAMIENKALAAKLPGILGATFKKDNYLDMMTFFSSKIGAEAGKIAAG